MKHIADIGTSVEEATTHNRLKRMQTKLQVCNYAKIASSPAQAPEEIWILVRARANHKPVRGHHFRGKDVVARQAELRGQVADATAQAKSGHAGGDDHASRGDETKSLGGRVEVEPGRATLRASDPFPSIHLHLIHPREVDHQSAVANAVTGGVVSAAAHSNLQLMPLRKTKCAYDILCVCTAHDHCRAAVDESVETTARPLVLCIRRADNISIQSTLQLVQAPI